MNCVKTLNWKFVKIHYYTNLYRPKGQGYPRLENTTVPCALYEERDHRLKDYMKYKLIIRHKGRVIFDQVGYNSLEAAIEEAACVCKQDSKGNGRFQYSIDVNPE